MGFSRQREVSSPDFRELQLRNCPKSPIGLDLKRQKSTKRVEKGLFRCSGGQEWRSQRLLWTLFGRFLRDCLKSPWRGV